MAAFGALFLLRIVTLPEAHHSKIKSTHGCFDLLSAF